MSNNTPKPVAKIELIYNDDNTITISATANLDLNGIISILDYALQNQIMRQENLLATDEYGQFLM